MYIVDSREGSFVMEAKKITPSSGLTGVFTYQMLHVVSKLFPTAMIKKKKVKTNSSERIFGIDPSRSRRVPMSGTQKN